MCVCAVLNSPLNIPKHRLWGLTVHLPSGLSHFLALQGRATGSLTTFHRVWTLAPRVKSLLVFLLPVHRAFMPQRSRDETHPPSLPCVCWYCSFCPDQWICHQSEHRNSLDQMLGNLGSCPTSGPRPRTWWVFSFLWDLESCPLMGPNSQLIPAVAPFPCFIGAFPNLQSQLTGQLTCFSLKRVLPPAPSLCVYFPAFGVSLTEGCPEETG